MAYSSVWYFSKMPEELTELICKYINDFDASFKDSQVLKTNVYEGNDTNKNIRSSKHAWIESNHWIHGLVWHYISLANKSNFLYDIDSIDGNTIQYTKYDPGDFYTWHADTVIDYAYKPELTRSTQNNIAQDKVNVMGESSRKLSFVMQLSDSDEYEGGELQLLDQNKNSFIMPKERGSMIVFDSRLSHRVRKIKSGIRKSIVCWAVGPRWR
jgi:Rps23 Pro-64 3,4-dihydroxylase Tpa1-like proline 4-hydroxylase